MAYVRITVDAPAKQAAAFSGTDLLSVAEETVRLVRAQLPVPEGTALQELAIFDSLEVSGTDTLAFETAEVVGAVAGPVVVTGVAVDDEIAKVIATTTTRTSVAGAAAGAVTVTGILTTDRLVAALKVTEANPPTCVDLTSEFTITLADTINNTGGTSSAGETLVVVYERDADLTAEFSVLEASCLDNTDGTSTAGKRLRATWFTRTIEA